MEGLSIWTWLESEPREFVELVGRILASLPGGEELEDLGFEPFPIGWKEAELLAELLSHLENKADVLEAVRLFKNPE